jgi:hypothetical protein
MRPFRAKRAGYVARLDTAERLVLAHVVGDTLELLHAAGSDARDAGADGPWPATRDVSPPDDPALRRLLPDASRDEPGVASEFRRLTQGDLVDAKEKRLVALAESLLDAPEGRGGDLVVARDGARDVASALTDVRLVLASRLGIETDAQSEALYDEVQGPRGESGDVDATRQFLGAVFLTAGWLQESLVTAMLDDLRADKR